MASATAGASGGVASLATARELILPLGIMACVLVILVPLPPALIDLLLVGSIALAVIVLLTTIYVRTPLEFSIFPSLLLAATLGRLVLNVATTRLILTQAQADGAAAAGGVIRTFGDFVARGNVVVGLIIFAIIVLIQFVVITKGATRISEVAARFALDGLPGRQVSIDADLASGAIDESTAQARRLELHRQADFLGAMDGASKFVRGDAVAGLMITGVNIVGGLFIGVVQAGMGPLEAGGLYTKLTIGDGLASQVPALLVSLAAGLLITRSSTATNLPSEFLNQLFARPQALVVSGAFLSLLVFTSLPRIPLFLIAGSCVGLAILMTRSEQRQRREATIEAKRSTAEPNIEQSLAVDPLELEIGVGLIRLADRGRGGDLLDRIQQVRQQVATEIGIVMPKVRVRDNTELGRSQFRIKIAESVVATGSAASSAELARQLASTVHGHADELLTRDATQYLIDQVRRVQPIVVDELVPTQMTLAEVQRVLQKLLREQVSIRQLSVILEALGDFVPQTKNSSLLTEHVRRRLARSISEKHRDAGQVLHAITLDPEIENRLAAGPADTQAGASSRFGAAEMEAVCREITAAAAGRPDANRPPVLLVAPHVRSAVRRAVMSQLPDLVVLSYHEVTPETRVNSFASVRVPLAVTTEAV